MQQKFQDFLFYTILLFLAYCLRITYGPAVSSLGLPLWVYLGQQYRPVPVLLLGALSSVATLLLFWLIPQLAYPQPLQWWHPVLAVSVGLVVSLRRTWRLRIPASVSFLGMAVAFFLAQAEIQRAWQFWAWTAAIAALATVAFTWPRVRQRHLWMSGWTALVVYWYLTSWAIYLMTPASLARSFFQGLWRPAVLDVMLLNLVVLLMDGLQHRESRYPWRSR